MLTIKILQHFLIRNINKNKVLIQGVYERLNGISLFMCNIYLFLHKYDKRQQKGINNFILQSI